MTEAFDKVAGSLADAIAFAQGDETKGKVHQVMKPERFQHRLDELTKAAMEARDIAGIEAANVLATATNQLRRAIKRAEALPDQWERFEIRQVNGPVIEFTGRLLCETSFADRRAGNQVTLELYETRGGAMVAVRAFERSDGGESEAATVITPTDDVQATRFAVMEAFNWHTEAKTMVRKKLGWDLRIEVE